MSNVVDTDFDFEGGDDSDEVESTATENEKTEAPKRKRGRPPGPRVKHPLPTGWETPNDLAIRVNYEGTLGQNDEGENITIDGTTLYAMAKNRSADPNVNEDDDAVGDFPSKKHTDGRLIVNIEEATAYLANRATELAERDKLRAQRAEERGKRQLRSFSKTIAGWAKAAS